MTTRTMGSTDSTQLSWKSSRITPSSSRRPDPRRHLRHNTTTNRNLHTTSSLKMTILMTQLSSMVSWAPVPPRRPLLP